MQNAIRDNYDVIVVGAGPAGLAAAAATASAALSTLLIDENAGPGGQIYRAITTTPVTNRAVLGADYWHGEALVQQLNATHADILHGATVWSLDPDLVVGISSGGVARLLKARRVILATGALERPFPFPGWTLPGVMTVGAAQTLMKASGLVPDGGTAIAGMGPLLWLYAAQVLRAGGRIEAILDTTPRSNYVAAARYLPEFLLSPLWRKGLQLMREVRARVRIVRGASELTATGDDRVRAISYSTDGGRREQIEIERLLIHQGVVPNVNLAMAAGVKHQWSEGQLCFVPILDPDGGTSIPGISVAGDGAGIAGAWAAEERGRLAGIAAARALKPHEPVADDQVTRQQLFRHERGRRFLDALYRPPEQFRLPSDDTTVCRCEEVTAGQIRQTAALGCEGPNQMKAFLRCGMGPCQGRLCGLTVTELIAQARASTPADVGYYRLRPPVKPLSLAELAAMPAESDATKAVVRL